MFAFHLCESNNDDSPCLTLVILLDFQEVLFDRESVLDILRSRRLLPMAIGLLPRKLQSRKIYPPPRGDNGTRFIVTLAKNSLLLFKTRQITCYFLISRLRNRNIYLSVVWAMRLEETNKSRR